MGNDEGGGAQACGGGAGGAHAGADARASLFPSQPFTVSRERW